MKNRKKIYLLLIISFFIIYSKDSIAQDEQKLSKKELKERKKAEKEAERKARYHAQIINDENSLDEGDRIIYIRYGEQSLQKVLQQVKDGLIDEGYLISSNNKGGTYFLTQAKRLRDTKVKLNTQIGPDFPQYGYILVNAYDKIFQGFNGGIQAEGAGIFPVRGYDPEIVRKGKRYENCIVMYGVIMLGPNDFSDKDYNVFDKKRPSTMGVISDEKASEVAFYSTSAEALEFSPGPDLFNVMLKVAKNIPDAKVITIKKYYLDAPVD